MVIELDVLETATDHNCENGQFIITVTAKGSGGGSTIKINIG